jgi:ABC-2 type transport system ATP-binding protein
MNVVEVRSLSRRFGEVAAVDGLTLSVAEGELFGLVGPDGAGKTTTLRMLAGVLDPTGGEASVAGLRLPKEAESVKETSGYMSQRFGLYADLTVLENIHFYADLYGVSRRERSERVGRLLDFSGLAPFRRRRAGDLSGGMKQKLGLSCALVHTPRLLFLDEPTNGVDPISRREFWGILYDLLRDGVTIVVSTAYLDEAERCGRVGLLDRGRLVACGTPEGLKALLPGTLLEVRCASCRETARALRAAGAGSVAVFGDSVHVVVPDAERGRREVENALREAGATDFEVRPVEPSLEDVYLSLVGGGPA